MVTKIVKKLDLYVSKISAYRRDFDETKCKSFLIKDDELLEKYNEIWEKVSNSIKRGFDREPVYNWKYLKKKYHEEKINIIFHNNKISKEGLLRICLSATLIDLVYRTSKNYYPQVFLEERKYVV